MSEWTPHDGGPCPVPAGTMVDVKFRDGWNSGSFNRADHWSDELEEADNWREKGSSGIVAYRIHRPADVPPVAEKPETVTRQDMAAYAALTGLLSDSALRSKPKEFAETAYKIADAMEAARGGK